MNNFYMAKCPAMALRTTVVKQPLLIKLIENKAAFSYNVMEFGD